MKSNAKEFLIVALDVDTFEEGTVIAKNFVDINSKFDENGANEIHASITGRKDKARP